MLLRTPDAGPAMKVLAGLGLETGIEPTHAGTDAMLGAALGPGAPAPERIVAELVAAGIRVRGFDVREPSLEERFVALTGEGFDLAP